MHHPSYWAIVPAAGAGRRMGSEVPKQYLPLLGRPVIQHTLEKLAAVEEVCGIVIALAPDDAYWSNLNLSLEKPLIVVEGGQERVHSVNNAVEYFYQQEMKVPDWFLVHDAARPCVRPEEIRELINLLREHPCGGILAARVRDTMKRSNADSEIQETVARENLWHALTPQLFRSQVLREALMASLDQPEKITDEASAVEALGYVPGLIEARMDNIKITRPEDLALAEFFLNQEAVRDAI